MRFSRNQIFALHPFAVFTAVATLALLSLGGLVTSHGVGLAVTDWPNTYGYNMFFFPISQWVGGIFYEHTHRLLASAVGLLTSILALWLHGTKARPFMRWTGVILIALSLVFIVAAPKRTADALVLALTGLALGGASFVWPACEPSPKWLRRLGLVAFLAVVLQGVLGGLRVVWLKDQIGIFHATLAQLFFALTCSIALFTSKWWSATNPKSEIRTPKEARKPNYQGPAGQNTPAASGPVRPSNFRPLSGFGFRFSDLFIPAATLLILCQLILGATMRHQHAGLAIPDYPLAYGKIWPATDPASVARYNQHRLEVTDANPIAAFQIILQMLHRLLAALILLAVASCAWLARRKHPRSRSDFGSRNSALVAVRQDFRVLEFGLRFSNALRHLTLLWIFLILLQAFLGAATIWSNKAADIATAHVVVGALSLALGTLLSLISLRSVVPLGSTQTSQVVEPISLHATPNTQHASSIASDAPIAHAPAHRVSHSVSPS